MNDQPLITDQMVARVLEQCCREGARQQSGTVFSDEPVFTEAVQRQLLAIVGRLVLSGAPAQLARDTANEVDQLVTFTAEVFRSAYRNLLGELMPDHDGVAEKPEGRGGSVACARDKQTREPISVPELSWMAAALNGGLREGSAYLLSDEPGSNKTTLAVHLAVSLATQGIPVLFVLTEQTPAELVGVVARVCGGKADAVPATVWKALDYELLDRPEELATLIRCKIPVRYPSVRLIIVDSLQGTGLASTATRAYQQVFDFLDEAKARGLITLLVAHVTKQGKVSGPKSLEHKVDVAMTLRKAYSLRHFFITKNRYGVEVVDPIVLTTEHGRLNLSPHAVSHTASMLGYVGAGDDLLEVQTSISLPKLGGRAELNCPFLPAKRIKQIISTVGKVPAIDLHDLS